jgi:hypothetical protein
MNLCRHHNITPSALFFKWDSFSLNQTRHAKDQKDYEPTPENISTFTTEVIKEVSARRFNPAGLKGTRTLYSPGQIGNNVQVYDKHTMQDALK